MGSNAGGFYGDLDLTQEDMEEINGNREADQAAHGSADNAADQGNTGNAPSGSLTITGTSQTLYPRTASFHAGQIITFSTHSGMGSIRIAVSEPEVELKPSGIKLGEIIGWRAWKYDGGLLRSCHIEDHWTPGVAMERGKKDGERAAGVHAWKAMAQAVPYADEHAEVREAYYDPSRDRHVFKNEPTIVIGSVALWGDVTEYEHGYKAEFGKPKTLDVCRGKPLTESEWADLRKRYGV